MEGPVTRFRVGLNLVCFVFLFEGFLAFPSIDEADHAHQKDAKDQGGEPRSDMQVLRLS